MQVAAAPRGGVTSIGRRPAGTGGKAGSVSLMDLLEAGMLAPGSDNLSITYKGISYSASLLRDGTIEWQGELAGGSWDLGAQGRQL